MPNPKVSIVIPVYNGANFLRQAIDSALLQTYKNVEVIVVNDGSNDRGKTEAIAKSYNEKVRYFFKENGGVASALNLGIKEMTGEWFAWLSHDDLFSPNRIEEDINLIKKDNSIRVTFCKLASIDSKGALIKEHEYILQKVTNPREALLLGGVNMCTMTIHRSCFDKVSLFNVLNKTTQDVEMSLKLSKNFDFYLNNNAVTYCRDHDDRGTYQLSEQHEKDMAFVANLIHSQFTINDFFPDIDKLNKKQIVSAWEWMGDVYRFFRAYKYADESYKNGFGRNPLSKVGLKYMLGTKTLESKLFKQVLSVIKNKK
jgi:glycosyltransferase involved in cell wall biosynthesis